jgi:plasmid replication initiation protein
MTQKKKKANQGITLIKKANNLIESRFKFDIWEMRYFLSLISQIRREDEEFRTYRVWYKDIVKTFGIKSHRSYDMLRDAAHTLLQKKFYITSVENGFERETAYHIIRTVNYLKKGQEGKEEVEKQEYIDVTIEPEMKPLLLQLQKNFTAYDLKYVINLGVYAVRMYELLKQYESIGKRTLWFDELKKMFELENEYPDFSNFYRRVVEPSIEEINKNTDIFVSEVEKIKEGKKVAALLFRFRKNKNTATNQLSLLLSPNENTIIQFEEAEILESKITGEDTESNSIDSDKRFTTFYPKVVETLGVSPSVFLDLAKKYTDEQLEQAIRVTHRAKIDGQIKTNISGFFVQAVKNGYTDQKEERIKKEKKEELKKKLETQKEALEAEKQSDIYDRIRELTAVNPFLTTDAIETIKQTELGRKLIQIEEDKLDRPLDVDDFRQIKDLRTLVIDTLFIKNMDSFSDIIQEYEEKFNQLKKTDIF